MTLPSSPSNGTLYTDPTTNRQFRYVAADNAWLPLKKTAFKELSDVSPVASAVGEALVWNDSAGQYEPTLTGSSPYVPVTVSSVAPLSSDIAEVGTVWSIETPKSARAAWVAVYTDNTVPETIWKKIFNSEGLILRPVIPVQSTAPTDPDPGSLWWDDSTLPIVKKYWDGSSWVSF